MNHDPSRHDSEPKGFWGSRYSILLIMYWRLAITEGAEMRAKFGEEFEQYARRTPGFLPRWSQRPTSA